MTSLASIVHHTSQAMNLEIFHSEESRQHVKYEEKLHPAGKQHSVEIVELLTVRSCLEFENNQLF